VALILGKKDVEGLLDQTQAMDALEPVMLEEAAGTTFHQPPFGGSSTKRRSYRVVGGGLYGLGRMGVRVGGQCSLYDTETGNLVAIVAYRWGVLRVGATMGLAARYLAPSDARTIGLLGTGQNALNILQCLKLVRPIERVEVYSPTPSHRAEFAEKATATLGIPVTAHDDPREVIADVDIIAVGTDSRTPVLSFADLRPGVHVTSMGTVTELEESVYLGVDQFVAPSRSQEIESASPNAHPNLEGPLLRLVEDGRYEPSRIVELGSILSGEVAPRNGPTDVTLFRDSLGGVGDLALANYVYERARELGRGVEVDL
jgi:ornithine cyclodeaminase